MSVIIERDADGRAILTVEQAVLVARMLSDDWDPSAPGTPEDALWWAFFEIERGKDGCLKPGNKIDALAGWVTRWAPVVAAAIEQRSAGIALMDDADHGESRRWTDACDATETAVCEALGEKGLALA